MTPNQGRHGREDGWWNTFWEIKVQNQEEFLNHQQLISGHDVGKEKQCVNFVDSSLIVFIEANIKIYFHFLICTYPDNNFKTFFSM